MDNRGSCRGNLIAALTLLLPIASCFEPGTSAPISAPSEEQVTTAALAPGGPPGAPSPGPVDPGEPPPLPPTDPNPPPPTPPSTLVCNGDPLTNRTCTCNSGGFVFDKTIANKYINNAARWAGFSNFIVADSGNSSAFPNVVDTSQYWNASNSLQPSGLGDDVGGQGYWKWFPNPAFVGGAPNYAATGEYYAILVFWNMSTQCAYWMTTSSNHPTSITAGKVPRAIYTKWEQLGQQTGVGFPVANPKPIYNIAGLTNVSHQVFSKGVITTKSGDAVGFAIGGATLEEESLRWAYMMDHVVDKFDPYAPEFRNRYSFKKAGLPLVGNAYAATCSSYLASTGGCRLPVKGWAARTVNNPTFDMVYSIKMGTATVPSLGGNVGVVTGNIENAWSAAYGGGPAFGRPFTGTLGYPLSREFVSTPGVVRQNFDNGYILWQNGAATIHTPPLCTVVCGSSNRCNPGCWHQGGETNCLAVGLPTSATTSGFGEVSAMTCEGAHVPEAPDVKFHEDMFAGRLSNQILTKYLEYPADVPGQATGTNPDGSPYILLRPRNNRPTRFAATCTNWTTSSSGGFDETPTENISDVSMIVIVRDNTAQANFITAIYSNDGVPSGGNLLGAYAAHDGTQGSYYRYTVYVYSNRLNTAQCELRYSDNSSDLLGLSPVVSKRHIGGRMIRVGALPADDFFEVDSYVTAPPQHENERTRMTLFRFAADHSAAALRSTIVGGNPADQDAKLTVPSTFDCFPGTAGAQYCHDRSRENYLLVGKTTNVYIPTGKQGAAIAIRADIVHGPLNVGRVSGNLETITPPFVAKPAQQLPPGRYLVGVEAWVEEAPGDTHRETNLSPGPIEPLIDGCISLPCPGNTTLSQFPRGRLNGPAFDYLVMMGSTANAATFAMPVTPTRKIPLGAFGSRGDSTKRHRFYHEVDVVPYRDPQTGQLRNWYYSPTITKREPRLWPLGSWFAQRNADQAHLGVATANMYYRKHTGLPIPGLGDPGPEYPGVLPNEFKNAADLLGARGVPYSYTPEITPSNFSFSDPIVRGRFQFNADVVHLTELGDLNLGYCEIGVPAEQREAFGEVLRRTDSRQWRNVYGVDENFELAPGCPNRQGLGAIFVASSQWPSGYPVRYLNDPLGLCQHDTKFPPDSFSTGQVNCPLINTGRQFQPVPIKVRSALTRNGLPSHQPILILGTHLSDSSAAENVDARRDEIIGLGNLVEALLVGAGSGEWSSVNRNGNAGVQASNNRIILIGDLNIYSHWFGEHYRLLKLLRDKFGFALDVAMAFDNSHGEAGGFSMHDVGGLGDACRQLPYDWANITNPVIRFSPQLDFSNCSDLHTMRYPWWARTCGSERHDMVILVGRGWEQDDAARVYRVMQDADPYVNPFAPPKQVGSTQSYGVRTRWEWSGAGNYKPRFNLIGTANEGDPAIFTDHRPTGATLRIWAGDGSSSR